MIDFKKLAKKSGQTAWLHEKLPRLEAMQSAVGSDKCDQVIYVEFEIARSPRVGDGFSSFYLAIHGGPTGYESVDLVKILENSKPDAVWVACMGSDRYRRMEISIDVIRAAVASYAVSYRFEVL